VTLEQLCERLGRLCSLALPVSETVAIHVQNDLVRNRIPRAEILDETTVTPLPVIGHDDAIERRLFGPMSGEADVNGHESSEKFASGSDAAGTLACSALNAIG
jgi:hypothetical protein